jgi:hypothetical protein
MMRFRTTAVLLLSLFGITLDANAQSTGRVSGRVLDQTGAVLPGVVIDLLVNSRELTTTSDDGASARVQRTIRRLAGGAGGVNDPTIFRIVPEE